MTSETHQIAAVPHEIIIEGHLSETWEEWFEGLTFEHTSDGRTILTGDIIDQAALHGLLKKIRDLGLPLLSVNRIPTAEDQLAAPDPEIQIDEAAEQGATALETSKSTAAPEIDEPSDSLQPPADH